MRRRAPAESRDGQYLLVGPWRHWVDEDARGDRLGEVVFGSESTVDTYRIYRLWFDRWLRGERNEVAAWPRVRLFALGENRWLGAAEWPLPGTRSVEYQIEQGVAGEPGRGRLTPAAVSEGVDRYRYDPANPTPFLWSRDLDSGAPDDYRSVEARSDVLVYTTEPLTAPLVVCGAVRATLVAATSARDTDWVARLSLVRADGYSMRLTEGWVRARTRRGNFRNDPLVPGAIETYQLDLWGTCVGAKPGERLRLSIMSGAFPLLARNLNTGGDLATETTPVVADQAVHHGPGRRSFVTLPVIDRPEWIAKP
jgi:putative CocE/NonD family hydrolase